MKRIILIGCLLLYFYGYSQRLSVNIGASFPLTDLGGRDEKKGSRFILDLDPQAISYSFGLSYHTWIRLSINYAHLEGADSLTSDQGDSYYRHRRQKYFTNNIWEISALKDINLGMAYGLFGGGVFAHDFNRKIQPVGILGGGIPVLSRPLTVNIELIYRVTITDNLDNFGGNIYSRGKDNFFTVTVNASYKKRINPMKCYKFY